MEHKKRFTRRSNFLLGAYGVCMALFVGVLYEAQIVNGEEVTTTQPVESSRGIITDRNGKVLVSNREIYVMTFDPDQVKDDPGLVPEEGHTVRQESAANALLRLLQLCRDQGIEWSDALPVSAEPPFAYTFSQVTGSRASLRTGTGPTRKLPGPPSSP